MQVERRRLHATAPGVGRQIEGGVGAQADGRVQKPAFLHVIVDIAERHVENDAAEELRGLTSRLPVMLAQHRRERSAVEQVDAMPFAARRAKTEHVTPPPPGTKSKRFTRSTARFPAHRTSNSGTSIPARRASASPAASSRTMSKPSSRTQLRDITIQLAPA